MYGNNQRIYLVYNRPVDFGFDAPEHAALRAARLEDAAVITPNPHAHALQPGRVVRSTNAIGLGVKLWKCWTAEKGIPHTTQVSASDEEWLWKGRRQWFFKPVAGHGSKAVYKGSKLTKSTFARILESDYVAQDFVPRSVRLALVYGKREILKDDVRLYTYQGALLLATARLYRGQTTNLRIPDGGFASLLLQQN